MYQSIINNVKSKMQEAVGKFQDELKAVRAGRAHPAILENLTVSYYGSQAPLKQMASVSAPDSNSLLITPWDKNSLNDIELAVRNSDLGFSPINDGRAVRVVFPPLTEERRTEMAKLVSKMAEEGKIILRQLRQESWLEIKNLEKEKKITEDDRYQAEEDLNKIIEGFNKNIQEILEKKVSELKQI